MTIGAVVSLAGVLAGGGVPGTGGGGTQWVRMIGTPVSGRGEPGVPVWAWLEAASRPAGQESRQRPTCTMRVLPADPRVDPGMVVTSSQDVDPRMAVTSWCAE